MFDKVSQAAEKLETNVSRRAYLDRLGQGALVVAGHACRTRHGQHNVPRTRHQCSWGLLLSHGHMLA